MSDCLVTKLKSSVNNDELLKIGEFRIKIISDYDSATISLASNVAQYCSSLTPGVLFNNGSNKVQLANTPVSIYTNGRGIISFADKYNLSEISQFSRSQSIEANIDELKYSNCKKLDFTKYSGNKIYGNIKNLPSSIQSFNARNCPDLVGDISLLPITLTTFSVILCNVSGEVKDMCEAMAAAGRTSGTMLFDAPSNNLITFNGYPFSGRWYITFNSATSISIGTTSGGNEIATATYSNSAWTWVFN